MVGECRVSVSDFRDGFATFLDDVSKGRGRIVLTRNGRDVACLISVTELRSLDEQLETLTARAARGAG